MRHWQYRDNMKFHLEIVPGSVTSRYFFSFISHHFLQLPPTLLLLLLSLQSCPTLCDPIDGSPPGSPVPGILQARTLEWVAISFSSAWKWKVKVKSLCRVPLFATPWTAVHQAPPSMGFSRQELWSGCHCLLCPLTLLTHKYPHPMFQLHKLFHCPQIQLLDDSVFSHMWFHLLGYLYPLLPTKNILKF